MDTILLFSLIVLRGGSAFPPTMNAQLHLVCLLPVLHVFHVLLSQILENRIKRSTRFRHLAVKPSITLSVHHRNSMNY